MKEIQHTTKRTDHGVDVPNLVELQLASYRWFLEEGLKELFESFSPISDFTGNHSIELIDFTLGEPKYDIIDCRARDATLESPIKARVRLRSQSGDVIESDVYLGDLPPDDRPGHVPCERGRARRRLAACPFAGHLLQRHPGLLGPSAVLRHAHSERRRVDGYRDRTRTKSSPYGSGRPASFRSRLCCAP